MTTAVPVADGIFTWPSDEPHLLGSRCVTCGNHEFPTQDGCSRCTGSDMETVELARRGTLWTWTIQGFPPKSPPYIGPSGDDFEPYGVGYVELPDQVRVEGRLTVSDPAQLEVGMEMELTIVPLGVDEDGAEIVTYAFRPVGREEN